MSADVGENDAQLYITLPDNYSGTQAGREIEKLCDPEKHGFDMLACMLIIACLEDRNPVNFRGA